MERPRPTGRKRRVGTTGGNNAKRRGSGLSGGSSSGFSGSSSGGFSGSSSGSSFSGSSFSGGSSGSRDGGSSLLLLLLALLLGNNSSNKKSGCLKRIVVLVIGFVLLSYLMNSCQGIGSQLSGGLYDPSAGSSVSQPVEQPASSSSNASDILSQILEGYTGGSALETAPSTSSPIGNTGSSAALDTSMFRAHEPDRTVSTMAREKYTTLRGNGRDEVTIMVYMCATDLESRSGMATADLNEMLKAKLNDENINLIIETGGCSRWQNSTIPSGKNMIYRITSKGLERLVGNLGKRNMTEPDNLSAFIQFCAKNYPANRNILILWDHGGGTLSGYGYDELYPNGTMTLDEINKALEEGGVKFDVIGFDACLMATLETALVAERTGDYLLASEAVEPGTGWYYTNWLTALSQNPSMDTVDLAKIIIDDFVAASQKAAPQSPATLSLMDLAELSGTLPSAFKAFSTSTSDLIEQDQYKVVSNARSGAKNFSSGQEINQIDLMHFASRIGTPASDELIEALNGAVKYNRCSKNVQNAYGVSVYFPGGRVNSVNTALATYDEIGMDESYADCIKDFASFSAAGQVTSTGTGSVLDVLLGGSGASGVGGSLLDAMLESAGGGHSASSSPSGVDLTSLLLNSLAGSSAYSNSGITANDLSSWFDTDRAVRAAAYVSEHRLDASRMVATEKNGQKVLSLTEEEWALISTLEKGVFLDDGEGYIDLGLDNVAEYNEDGDLILDFDGNWMAINGQIVACYFVGADEVDGNYIIAQRIPALLNGERVELMVVFDDENPYGKVLGGSPVYETEQPTNAKGLIEIAQGDEIDFLCSYYTYDGEYVDDFYLGDTMTVSGALEIWDLPAGGEGALCTYRITDIYGNHFFTEALGYES